MEVDATIQHEGAFNFDLCTVHRRHESIFSIFEVHVAASARVAVAAYRGTGLSVCLSYEREVPLRASVKRVWVIVS